MISNIAYGSKNLHILVKNTRVTENLWYKGVESLQSVMLNLMCEIEPSY